MSSQSVVCLDSVCVAYTHKYGLVLSVVPGNVKRSGNLSSMDMGASWSLTCSPSHHDLPLHLARYEDQAGYEANLVILNFI